MDSVAMAKNAQMDLLIEMDRICQKHNIRYFLTAGTLIGAIRHDGFIPWDDDIDVGMLREEFDRFREVCKDELDPAYFYHDWTLDPASPHPFAKLKIRGTHYPETLAAKSDMNDCVYIDIFPYDNAPDSEFLRKIHHIKRYLIKKILLLRCNFDLSGGRLGRRILYGTLKFLSRIRSVEGWKKAYTRMQQQYNDQPAEKVVNLGGAYSYAKESIPRTVVEKTVPHLFEGKLFQVPEGYDAFLRNCYGDYMQLPPEEQRVGRHEIVGIDFGTYQIRFVGQEDTVGDDQ